MTIGGCDSLTVIKQKTARASAQMTLSSGWIIKAERNAGKPLKRHPAVFVTDDAYFSIFWTILSAHIDRFFDCMRAPSVRD